MALIREHIPELMLLIAAVLALYFIWSLGWYERHPWPGSTRRELEEQIERNQREREEAQRKKLHDEHIKETKKP